jgi:hypothetical protein
MNGDNQDREIKGLLAALKFFNIHKGIILTLNQTDKILINGYQIDVISSYSYRVLP